MRRVAVIGVGVTKFGKHDRTSAELFAEAAARRPHRRGHAAERRSRRSTTATWWAARPSSSCTRARRPPPCSAFPPCPPPASRPPARLSHAAFRHAVMEIARGRLGRRPGRRRRARAERDDRVATEYFAYCSDAALGAAAGPHLPRRVRAGGAGAHGQVRHDRGADGRGGREEPPHGVLNPKAQFQKEITLEQVLKARMVADPLKLYDCCPFTDGGAALVLASEEVARKARRPIWVLASAAASDWMLIGDKRDLSRVPATERAAARRLPPGRARAHRRRRGGAARLLHDRRDRRHRGARPLRAGHRRHRGREGVDEPRRQDPGQSVGRSQGQGPSHRRHRARRRSPRSSPSSAATPDRDRSTAPGSGSPTRSAATPPPCRGEPVRP